MDFLNIFTDYGTVVIISLIMLSFVAGFIDAVVGGGGLIQIPALLISLPHFPFRALAFTMDDYHSGDINLFWDDIRVNAKLRALEFLNQK